MNEKNEEKSINQFETLVNISKQSVKNSYSTDDFVRAIPVQVLFFFGINVIKPHKIIPKLGSNKASLTDFISSCSVKRIAKFISIKTRKIKERMGT